MGERLHKREECKLRRACCQGCDVVLVSLEFGRLHGPLVEAGIRSLASLRSESTSGLVTKLKGVGKQCNAAVCQKLLTLGLLTSTSDAPEPLVLMRD